jgi:hypothetical protein
MFDRADIDGRYLLPNWVKSSPRRGRLADGVSMESSGPSHQPYLERKIKKEIIPGLSRKTFQKTRGFF